MRRSTFAIAGGLAAFLLSGNLIIWILPWSANPHWLSREMWIAIPFILALATLLAAFIAARLAPRAPYAHGLPFAALPFVRAYDGIVVHNPMWWVGLVATGGIAAAVAGTYLAWRHRRVSVLRRAHN